MEQEEEFFTNLYKTNKDRIYRICRYYVSDKDLAKDLFQEIFTNIWKNLENFRGEASINTWIYRIAINTSISFVNIIKRNNSAREELTDEINDQHWIPNKDKDGIEQQLRQFYLCIKQLSASEKLIISLVLEDLSYKEMAKICEMSEGNLRVKVHRIKQKLKIILEGMNHGI